MPIRQTLRPEIGWMWGSSWVGVQLRVSSLFDSVGGDHLCELFKVLVVFLLLLLCGLVPWTDHQAHLTGMYGPFFLIDLETNLTRSNWPPAHPRSQGNKRACSCVAAKITLLPNNCNWFTNLRSGMVGIRGSIVQLWCQHFVPLLFNSHSCHFGEIYWIELPRTKSSHPTHPVDWFDGVEIICVNCSRFLWCFCCCFFVVWFHEQIIKHIWQGCMVHSFWSILKQI